MGVCVAYAAPMQRIQPAANPVFPRSPLPILCESDRFVSMDRSEAYFRGRQDMGKSYDWNGMLVAYGNEMPVDPGYFVPYSKRKPNSRYDVGKLVVRRLTSMVFGSGRFPEIRVEGDEDAEDYVRTLATVSRLPTRMAEARDLGGATGTACLSWGFVKGIPRVQVHNPKHVLVMEWDDEDELRPKSVMKAFAYHKREYNHETKKIEKRTYWRVRWWDQHREYTWRAIPMEIAQTPNWADYGPPIEVVHNYGFVPFYWIQNRPCSSDYDGESDFDGQEDTIDQINQLVSATTKGTVANVDPTLVVHMNNEQGSIRKGSDNAIFSPNGAEYLELKGTAVMAAERQIDRLIKGVLDTSGVVLADPDKLSGAAQSARALEILYAPMLANCDVLREQYGDHAVLPILLDMLRVSRTMQDPVTDPKTGMVTRSLVVLPPRMEKMDEGDETKEVAVERVPGESEQISLNWRPYFSPTWADINAAVGAAKNANGGKPVISQRTSTQSIAPMFGVKDVDAEMDAMEHEAEEAVERQQKMFSDGGLFNTPPGGPPKKPTKKDPKEPPPKDPDDDPKDE